MVTSIREEALPAQVAVMLVTEAADRLDALARTITVQKPAHRDRQQMRIADLLDSLERAADRSAQTADAALFRTIRRMMLLATVQNDPVRCHQAIALLRRLAERRRGPIDIEARRTIC